MASYYMSRRPCSYFSYYNNTLGGQLAYQRQLISAYDNVYSLLMSEMCTSVYSITSMVKEPSKSQFLEYITHPLKQSGLSSIILNEENTKQNTPRLKELRQEFLRDKDSFLFDSNEVCKWCNDYGLGSSLRLQSPCLLAKL